MVNLKRPETDIGEWEGGTVIIENKKQVVLDKIKVAFFKYGLSSELSNHLNNLGYDHMELSSINVNRCLTKQGYDIEVIFKGIDPNYITVGYTPEKDYEENTHLFISEAEIINNKK